MLIEITEREQLLLGFIINIEFHRLAVAAVALQQGRVFRRYERVLLQQQLQGGEGGVETAGGIQARSEPEADVVCLQEAVHPGDLLQGADADALLSGPAPPVHDARAGGFHPPAARGPPRCRVRQDRACLRSNSGKRRAFSSAWATLKTSPAVQK